MHSSIISWFVSWISIPTPPRSRVQTNFHIYYNLASGSEWAPIATEQSKHTLVVAVDALSDVTSLDQADALLLDHVDRLSERGTHAADLDPRSALLHQVLYMQRKVGMCAAPCLCA